MKKLAVIGANYLQRPLVEKAKAMGLYVICFAWRQGAVCESIADEFYPISVTDKEQILSICQEKKIDGICTIASDVAAPTVAYVAEKMGLVGNTYKAALNANNKFLMRKAFENDHLPSPQFKLIANIEQAISVQWNYPIIVKPTDRSGSLGVVKVESAKDLLLTVKNALDFSFEHKVLVEEYIEGREISVEFISYNGIHYPLQITDKITTGAPHFVELEHHQPAQLSANQFDEINKITERALNALGITNGASHSEYKITSNGQIYIIEIGARMGGDFIGSNLVQLSTGYDFVQGVINVALGEFTEPQITEQCFSGVYFLSKETGHLLSVFRNINLYPEIKYSEITDAILRPISCSGDRSGYFIYQGNKKFTI